MNRIKMLFLMLLTTLANNRGEVEQAEEEEEETSEEEDGEEESEEGDEEEEGEEGDEDEEEEEDGEDGSGNNVRSKSIPRARFDKVNEKAKKIDRLIELGILVENANGDVVVNPKKAMLKDEEEQPNPKGADYYFEEKDVDKESWPLVQKINKGFKKFDVLANKMAYTLIQLQSENAILREYPEFLQKGGPLRKKAMHILKNDPEFKKKYGGDPERGFWAVKRAAELLVGKRTPAPKKKPSSRFIIGKGDGTTGSGKQKVVDIENMSEAELDKLEKQEFETGGGRTPKRR